uniref:PHYHIP_C domain-containing protein n=1 Tax=Haemonchus contortus TaxID=6289 RepID=A0A7I5E5X3_HAECO
MDWGPDTWRPYGQWANEGPVRNTTWRGRLDGLRSSFLNSRSGFELHRSSYHPHPYGRPVFFNQQSFVTPHAERSHHRPSWPEFRDARSTAARGLFADFSENTPPNPLTLTCEISAQKVDISWKPPTHQKGIRYLLECTDKESGRKWVFDQSYTQTQRELKTTPGNTYCIRLQCESLTDNRVIAAVYKEIKAVFSYDEMVRMYHKCVNFVGTKMQPFEVLYRCKPREYWDEIHHFHDGLMEKYMKDNNGQPANRINGIISGLFFSARVYADGSLPTQSPFGNVRMLVPPGALLDPTINNFYFADFYCNYYTHYVTVVICRKGSETDNYCYMKLHQMDPEDNPFLTVTVPRHPHYAPTYCVNSGVWVEIYYTEDIPLWLGRFDSIQTTGAGTSKIGGLPNNKHCERCNLYPIPYPDEVNAENKESNEDNLDVADITVAEDPLNSTFRVLINQNKSDLTEDWEDVIEVICGMVDQVCEVHKEDQTKDPIAASDAVIDATFLTMNRELEKCHDLMVQKAANFLKEVVENIRAKRSVLEQSIRHLGVLQKLQRPALPTDGVSRRAIL